MRIKFMLVSAAVALFTLGALAEAASFHTAKTFSPKPGGTLKVEASFQDVKVELVPGTAVEVTVDLKVSTWPQGSKEAIQAYEPVFEEKGDTILVRSKSGFGLTVGYSNASGLIAVRMPPGMNLDLHTGSGDVAVWGGLAGKDLTCGTGSGDVKIRLTAPAGTASIHTGSGDIQFAGGASSFEGEAGSGDITAEGLSGPATFRSGSGDVNAAWAGIAPGAKVKAHAGSGDIRLAFPAATMIAGSLDTGSGDMHVDFPGTRVNHGRRWTFAGGSGAVDVSAETGSGDLAVTTSK